MASMTWQEILDKSALLRSTAVLCKEKQQYARAHECLEQALAILQSAGEDADQVTIVKVLHELGALAQEQGQIDQAEQFYLQSLELCERTLGPEAIGTATRLNHLAWIYRLKGDIPTVEACLTRSLHIYLNRLGAVNKSVALMLMALAVLNKRLGNFELAEEYRLDLKFIEEQLEGISRDAEAGMSISKTDSAKKRKSTLDLKRYGIIPGDSNDFPQVEFVIESLLGGVDARDLSWEDSIEDECNLILKLMDDYLENVRGKKKGPLESFQENPDESVSVQAGVTGNSRSSAAIRVRISFIDQCELRLRKLNDPAQVTGATFVPGALVPDDLLEELFRGARIAYGDMRFPFGGGLQFELIEALVHPKFDQKAPFRHAGWIAMDRWSRLNGIPMNPDSKSRLWQYPLM